MAIRCRKAASFRQGPIIIRHVFIQVAHFGHELRPIAHAQGLDQSRHMAAIDGAQHGPGMRLSHRTAAEGNQLIEQAQPSRMLPSAARASSAMAGTSKEICSAMQMVLSRSPIKLADNRFKLNCRQRDKTVTGVSADPCGQQKFHMRRRLFERLQQCVEEWFDSMCTSSMRYTL